MGFVEPTVKVFGGRLLACVIRNILQVNYTTLQDSIVDPVAYDSGLLACDEHQI